MHLIKVRVTAGARTNSIEEMAPDTFRVRVKAKAKDNEANHAVTTLLASHLHIPTTKLRMIKGRQSPSKTFSVLN